MDFLQKYVHGVFELPLPRNAQKRTKKKKSRNKSRMVGGWVWDLANARGGPSILFWRPLVLVRPRPCPRGGRKINVKKRTYVCSPTYFIWPGIVLDVRFRIFFNRVFEFPLSRNAQKRPPKKSTRASELECRCSTCGGAGESRSGGRKRRSSLVGRRTLCLRGGKTGKREEACESRRAASTQPDTAAKASCRSHASGSGARGALRRRQLGCWVRRRRGSCRPACWRLERLGVAVASCGCVRALCVRGAREGRARVFFWRRGGGGVAPPCSSQKNLFIREMSFSLRILLFR
jgi:hypothetical protein